MTVAYRAGVVSQRGLAGCCAELGIELSQHHSALSDARATAGILARLLPPHGYVVPGTAPSWPVPPSEVPIRLRTDPPLPRVDHGLGNLASRVGVPAGTDVDEEAAIAYLGLLDRVLEDRHITADEVAALAGVAEEWGISREAATRLHLGYLNAVWQLTRSDGVVTKAEKDDIEILAELLGVPVAPVDDAASLATSLMGRAESIVGPEASIEPWRPSELVGKTVCFTGESVCAIGGRPLSREDQEHLADQAGMVVKSGVSKRLNFLVVADPDSQSTKARQAQTLGVRRIAERAFWRSLGLSVD